MSKKLYALDESDVVKIAKVAKGFEIVSTRLSRFDDTRLNRVFAASLVPLDKDAAVERMARALAESLHGGDFWDDYLEDGITFAVNREDFRSDARAALDALLEDRNE